MRISDWSSDVCSSDLQGLATCSFFLAADVDQLTLFGHDFQFIKLNGCKSQHLTGAWMTYGFRSEAAVGPGQPHIKHNAQQGRSEERRVGKEGVGTCSIWVARYQ